MRNRIIYTALTVMLLHGQLLFSQPFSTKEHVDINNIKSAILVHGDMNWDPTTGNNECEFPAGSGLHVCHNTSIWMTAIDEFNQLQSSAQMYRHGNDFWPGPLDNNGALNMATSTKWAKIWKVNFFDINNHLGNSTHTISNTPQSVLEWPAKGNIYAKGNGAVALSINTDMAPFVDVNSDGMYNPLAGDYPDMKGDQMLWWVFSDNGPTHNNTMSQPMQVEIHAKAYAYKRNTLIDNVVFYEMEVRNKSQTNYPEFLIGIHANMDIGYYNDDYIGFDSSGRLGYTYNATLIDGLGQTKSYNSTPPIAGYTLLEIPGDSGTNVVAAGSFMTFNNDNTVSGNPADGSDYRDYMSSKYRDGQHLNNDYSGYGIKSNGRGSGTLASYIFNGNPADTSTWSECASGNTSGDRRVVLATNEFVLNKSTSAKIAFALVVTDRGSNNTCPDINITGIKEVTDTAWKNYRNPPKSFVSVQSSVYDKWLGVYPNPAHNVLNVISGIQLHANASVKIYDFNGRTQEIAYTIIDNKIKVDVSSLVHGIYNIVYQSGDVYQSAVFIKE